MVMKQRRYETHRDIVEEFIGIPHKTQKIQAVYQEKIKDILHATENNDAIRAHIDQQAWEMLWQTTYKQNNRREHAIENLRYLLIKLRNIHIQSGMTKTQLSQERKKILGGKVLQTHATWQRYYTTYTRIRKHDIQSYHIGSTATNNFVQAIIMAFPELELTEEMFFHNVRWLSSMSIEERIKLYRDKIMNKYPQLAEAVHHASPTGDWRKETIKYLLPPRITAQVIEDMGIYQRPQEIGIQHYYDLVIAAFPEYPLKWVMYGKKWSRKKKLHASYFFTEALWVDCDHPHHHEIYDLYRNWQTSKAQEKLWAYIQQDFMHLENPQEMSSLLGDAFAKTYEMIEGLEEMVYYYNLDTLIKWATSWAYQQQKRQSLAGAKECNDEWLYQRTA